MRRSQSSSSSDRKQKNVQAAVVRRKAQAGTFRASRKASRNGRCSSGRRLSCALSLGGRVRGALAGSPDSERGGRGVRDLVLAATDEETRATAREVSNVFPQAYLCLAALASAWLVFAASDGEGSRPYATRTHEWASRGPPWASPGSRWTSRRTCSAASGRNSASVLRAPERTPRARRACCPAGVLFLLLDPPRVEDVVARRARDRTRDRRRENPTPSTAVLDVGADARVRAFLWFPHSVTWRQGREGNRHWVSDTMGGASMGTFFLSAALLGCSPAWRRGASAARKGKESSTTGFVLHRGSTASGSL